MPTTPSSRPVFLFAATYVSVVLLLIGLASWKDILHLHEMKLAEASRLAVLMVERFDRSATSADIILRHVQADAEESLARTGRLDQLPWEDFHEAAQALPDPGSLWMIDANGQLRMTSTERETPTHNFSDREYFPHHQGGTESYLSSAVKGRITSQYHWLVSRRLNTPDGRFAGVVLAAMEGTGLQAIHRAVDLGPGAVLSVRRIDGSLVMRQPMNDALLGRPTPASPEFDAIVMSPETAGWREGPALFTDDEAPVLQAWHKTAHHAMVASVLVPVDVLWQLWRPEAMAYGAMFLASLVPLFFVVRLGVRSMGAEAKVRASLEQLNDHQQQLLRDQQTVALRQRMFLDTVSHEFRTPLAIIDSTVQVLARLGADGGSAPAAAKLEKIQRATRRLNALIETCLAEDRLEGAANALRLAPTNLAALVHGVAYDWPRVVVRDDAATPDKARRVPVDAPLLGIAVRNIVENAVKYSLPDTPVDVTIAHDADAAIITVSNQGPGIASQDLPHIYEKYFRGHKSLENTAGLGLGLNIARTIIEQHGGRIEVVSVPDHMTTFTIHLKRPATKPFSLNYSSKSKYTPD